MAKLEVIGMGCRSCIALLKNAQEAVRQEGRSDPAEKVTDYNRILVLDPLAMPALAIDGKVVVAGRIATPAEIRGWLPSAALAADHAPFGAGRRAPPKRQIAGLHRGGTGE